MTAATEVTEVTVVTVVTVVTTEKAMKNHCHGKKIVKKKNYLKFFLMQNHLEFFFKNVSLKKILHLGDIKSLDHYR